MIRIGLTGGIGSGKSRVADWLQRWGGAVIDTDQISRALTAADGAALPLLHAAFGPDIFDASGALDRAVLRERVFADAGARQRLQAILHPMIRQETLKQAGQIMRERRGHYLVYVVPLLVESGHWRDRVDRVCVVDCDPATQIARVQARSQQTGSPLDTPAIQRIIAAQTSRAARLAAADDVIVNDAATTLAQLRASVQCLHDYWCTLSDNPQHNSA